MNTAPGGTKTGYAQFKQAAAPTGHPIPGSQHWNNNVAAAREGGTNWILACLGGGARLWNTPTVVTGRLSSVENDDWMPGFQNFLKYWWHTLVWLAAVALQLACGLGTMMADEPGAGFLQPKETTYTCTALAETDDAAGNCPAIAPGPVCGTGAGTGGVGNCLDLATQYTAATEANGYLEVPSDETKMIGMLSSICFVVGFAFFYFTSAFMPLDSFTKTGAWQVITLSLLGYGLVGSFFLLAKASAVTENDEASGFMLYLFSSLVGSLAVFTYYTFAADLNFAYIKKGIVPGLALGTQVIVQWMINSGEGVDTAAGGVKDSTGGAYAARFKEITTFILVIDAVALGLVIIVRTALSFWYKGNDADTVAAFSLAAVKNWPVFRSFVVLAFGITALLSIWQFDCMALTEWFVGSTTVYAGSTAQILRLYSTVSMIIHVGFFFMLLTPDTADIEKQVEATKEAKEAAGA